MPHSWSACLCWSFLRFADSALDQLGAQRAGVGIGHDLVVIAVHDQRRHGELLQVLGEVRLGEGHDAVVGALVLGVGPIRCKPLGLMVDFGQSASFDTFFWAAPRIARCKNFAKLSHGFPVSGGERRCDDGE